MIRAFGSLAVAVALMTLGRRSSAQGMEPARFADSARASKLAAGYPAIDQLFTAFATREHVPGAAWGVIVDGKLAHVGVTGYRDVAAHALVDTNTVFRIASMTKSFTAMSILILRDEGKLSLDDPAEKYVPELKTLKYPTTDSPRLTIRLLLSHNTGWPEDNPWGDQQLSIADSTLAQMIERGIPFSHAPGTGYEYSNYAFMILGRIITRVSGVPYTKFVQQRILAPLGLRSSTLEFSQVPRERLALGYRWEDSQWKLEPQLPDGAGGSMGGMLTSLHDLGIYVGTFLASWPPRDGAEVGPLARGSMREMQQIQRSRVPVVTVDSATKQIALFSGGYGFGLRIWADCRFAHQVAHGGGLPGFGTQMVWLPEYGVGIIAFGNRTYTSWGPVFDNAFAILQGTGGLEARVPQPSVALSGAREQVTRLVVKWSDPLADSFAAMNLYMDHDKAHRRAQLDSLHAKLGACSAGNGWDLVENSLRGQWVMPCEHGALRVSITMAPTMPVKVQYLDLTPDVRRPRTEICK